MHPFPPLDELQWLLGDELDTITFGAYMVSFAFVSGGRLAVEFRLEQHAPGVDVRTYDFQRREGDTALTELFLKTVSHIDRTSETLLRITFDGECTLVVQSELGPYECGQIYHPNGDFTVF
jgi:hypothetical protein